MEPILNIRSRKVNQWMNNYISPGPVAPLGDVIVNEKLRKSCPEAGLRYTYRDSDLKYRGAGVQDGTWYNYHNKALAAKTNRQSFYDQVYSISNVGFVAQDIRLQDLKSDTRLLAAPKFGWKNQKATLLNARVTGEQFLPQPMGYQPRGISRGLQPRINTLVDNTVAIGEIKPLEKLEPVVNNVPKLAGRDLNYGIENIKKPSVQQNQIPNINGGLMRGATKY